MFEDKLEVKAEKKKMAEAAIISEEKTENADNSWQERKEDLESSGTDNNNVGIEIDMKTNLEAKGVKVKKSIYWKRHLE